MLCDVINKWCKLAIIILLPLKEVIKHNYCCVHSYYIIYYTYYNYILLERQKNVLNTDDVFAEKIKFCVFYSQPVSE